MIKEMFYDPSLFSGLGHFYFGKSCLINAGKTANCQFYNTYRFAWVGIEGFFNPQS